MTAFRRSVARGWGFLQQVSGWRLGACGVTMSLLAVQLLLIALVGVRATQDAILEHGAVHLDVLPGTLDQRIQQLHVDLRAIPSVREVTYVPREQVFAEEQSRDASLGEFLEQYGLANPFPDAFVVVPDDASAYADLRRFVERSETGIDAVALSDIAVREVSVGQLLAAADTARMGGTLLLLLVAFGAVLLSMHLLVNLTLARRPDITAEMLTGAAPSVLAAPVTTAGIIVLLGSLVCATVLAAVVVALLSVTPSSAAIGSWLLGSVLAEWSATLPIMLSIEAGAMVMLAWIVGRSGLTRVS